MPWTVLQQPWQELGTSWAAPSVQSLGGLQHVHKVFLIVPTGVIGHAEVGCVRKLDLKDLRLFLGRDDVYHRDVWNGRPMRQLPLLTLSILQPVWGLEGGTHLGVMPGSGTQKEFLKRRLRQNL